MLLRERIIATLASHPGGMGLQELRAELYDVRIAGVGNAVSDLCREGRIERIGHARYRLPAPKQPRLSAAPVPVTSDFLQPPSLARLMAGR